MPSLSSWSDGEGAVSCVAIKKASPQHIQRMLDMFITEKRGSGVEEATSDDELDRELLAPRGKDSLCPSVRELSSLLVASSHPTSMPRRLLEMSSSLLSLG